MATPTPATVLTLIEIVGWLEVVTPTCVRVSADGSGRTVETVATPTTMPEVTVTSPDADTADVVTTPTPATVLTLTEVIAWLVVAAPTWARVATLGSGRTVELATTPTIMREVVVTSLDAPSWVVVTTPAFATAPALTVIVGWLRVAAPTWARVAALGSGRTVDADATPTLATVATAVVRVGWLRVVAPRNTPALTVLSVDAATESMDTLST